MKDIDPQAAMEQIWRIAPQYAKAKAEAAYLEEFRKSKKAILMGESKETSIGGQERDAYSHAEYLELLTGYRQAIETAEALRWKLTAAQAAIEIWRTQQANNRTIERAAR